MRNSRYYRQRLNRLSQAASALLTLCAISLAGQAPAQELRAAALAVSCAHCHGPGGNSPGAVPSIARLDADEMAEHLRAFRSDAREGTIMNRIAKGYSDAEIDALSTYLGASE